MIGGLPQGDLVGNGATTIQYTANGEASDYMLGAFGIIAMSPELGTSDLNTATFFIESAKDLKNVLSSNFKWIYFVAKSLFARVNVNHLTTVYNETTNLVNVSLTVSNSGYLNSLNS